MRHLAFVVGYVIVAMLCVRGLAMSAPEYPGIAAASFAFYGLLGMCTASIAYGSANKRLVRFPGRVASLFIGASAAATFFGALQAFPQSNLLVALCAALVLAALVSSLGSYCAPVKSPTGNRA
jgi:hypothetical protein